MLGAWVGGALDGGAVGTPLMGVVDCEGVVASFGTPPGIPDLVGACGVP